MNYRHEWKFQVDRWDLPTLRARLRAVAQPDLHGAEGRYQVRSLYFDTPGDTALREKLNGAARREKFRLRCYNGDVSFLRLEKKCKWNGLGWKETAPLTAVQAQALVDGELNWLADSDQPLLQELYRKSRVQGLRPKTIVDYTREPFVYPAGNVRVTLDYDIHTGLGRTNFLDPQCVTIPVRGSPVVLEVKWDRFLPDIIRAAVELKGRRASALSKYALCRAYD